jgi:uncharacterized protein
MRPAGAGIHRAQASDGRWHFQHGPIDLIILVEGPLRLCADVIERAWQRFQTVLTELSAELPQLRTDAMPASQLNSPIARRMAAACWPFHSQFDLFITPMAAVAGSVAQELLACLVRPGIRRAVVNNGGDIALYLADGAHFEIGVVADLELKSPSMLPELAARIRIDSSHCINGVATSGWRGRSLSLGIADAVTVLANTAAIADAAATLIANAVNVEHSGIMRLPANQVRDDSDLHDRLVTRSVADLPRACVDLALDRGAEFAHRVVAAGLIDSAFLALQGSTRTVHAASRSSQHLIALNVGAQVICDAAYS